MANADCWRRFRQYYFHDQNLGLSLDISRMGFADDFFEKSAVAMQAAYAEMAALEQGAIANPDEQRMVGHYWLRAPDLAPSAQLSSEIRETVTAVKAFAADVHAGRTAPPGGGRFRQFLVIGIGGSALGPMFVSDALTDPARDPMGFHLLDNTDPDGMARVLCALDGKLAETLCLVISKSGGTPETRNGMLTASAAFEKAGLAFAKHAVAITGDGSKLDQQAKKDGWIRRFPMWDWVGGRTSETSAVGLLPAALQGFDIDALLGGAAACDELTRQSDTLRNPAALLALMWLHATDGRGSRDMVVLPYKDRLLLFSRYLQQLIMESIGKRDDLAGRRVDQGLAVYGNKGSTDQHAYVQQLRDGLDNFFVTFIRVLEDGGDSLEIEPGVRAGDYLHGFMLGTREALSGNERRSMTITVRRVDASTIGALIALFERAVGFYASLIGINAYHQPGVEAGKKAASAVLALQGKVCAALSKTPQSASAIASAINEPDRAEAVFLVLEHLAANHRVGRSGDPSVPAASLFTAL